MDINRINALTLAAMSGDPLACFTKWSAIVAPDGNLEEVLDGAEAELRGTQNGYLMLHALALVYWRLGDRWLGIDTFRRCVIPAAARPEQPVDPKAIENEYAAYDYNEVRLHHSAIDEFLEVAAPWLDAGRGVVVDAACGLGLAAEGLRPYASRLIGIDLSATMVERARSRGLYDEVVEGDMVQALASLPDTATAVVCSGATYYLPDLAPFLTAAASALKPGGLLLFSDFAAPTELGTGVTCGGTRRHCRSENFTRALASAAGFDEVMLCELLSFGIPALFWAFRRRG